MSCLTMLTEDEIKYVCSVIPLKVSVSHFKRFPKEFAKVKPGFRQTSIKNQDQMSELLFKNRNLSFISSYIETMINRWVDDINKEIARLTESGESKESAWLQVLPFCFFVDDVSIFLKLIGEEMSDDAIYVLGQCISKIKNLDIEQQKRNALLENKTDELGKAKHTATQIQVELDKNKVKLTNSVNEIKTLKRANIELEKLTGIVQNKEREANELRKQLKERNSAIHQLQTQLATAIADQRQLEEKIREDIEAQNFMKMIEQAATLMPKCPIDMEEFRDCLGYNLDNVGIAINADYYSLLRDYLCEILFTGKPILLNRSAGLSLIKCVSNALVASSKVATLVFSPNISLTEIEKFLSAKNRIYCIDNFIGKYDETILTTICERHRNKIIFLTVAYEKTLNFMPETFLKYCHYVNVNRIEAFSREGFLSEGPSSVEETDADISVADYVPNRWSTLLKEIIEEVGICSELATYKTFSVLDEETLTRVLTFDVLPFCIDVLGIKPFALSERLNKYAGASGRCAHKDLLGRWFS
jgi:hypothetical protein